MKPPGKYDALTQQALFQALSLQPGAAAAALLIIFGGENSCGFSVSALDPAVLPLVPGILRAVAEMIENDGPDSDVYQSPLM